MAAGQLSAKGTFMTFAGQTFKATNIRTARSVSEIPATHLLSTQEEFIAGFPSREVSLDALGTTAIQEGDQGLLVISYSDGTSFPEGGAEQYTCMKADQSAEVNGLLKTSLTFKPASGLVN